MNSTKFFKKELRPLQKDYFPTTFDASLSSYFITREECRMTPEAFDLGSQMNPARLAETLERLWAGTELEPLAKPLAQLAKQVTSVENQSDDVSPFIYVMY